jgi:hypothetical protein
MLSSTPFTRSLGGLCLGLALAVCAWAQTNTSRISGTVTDSTGAVISGAKVTAKNDATGIAQTQTTTEAGLYSFPSLPVGGYTITVEMTGFKTANQAGVIIQVNTPVTVDISLVVGQTNEIVNITGGVERLQTDNATIGNVVQQKAIESLPLNGRNPLTLLTLEPGVTQRSFGGIGSGVHVNGSRDRAFNVTIDGIEANESTVPNPVSNLFRINPDNIQEYKVTTNNATAEEGRNSGASISIATRGGTNEYHGTLFEFMRNTALNSNDFFANARGTQKPEVKLHQYGVEGGGPIIKNKTFFFGSWQGQNVKFTQPIDQTFGFPTIYTPSMLAGKYRYLKGGVNSPSLVDPKTGALAPGVRECANATDTNCIASYDIFANDPRRIGIDPAIAKLFNAYPKPNDYSVGDGLNTATYSWNPPTQNEGPNFAIRIDHTINERNTVFGRFLYADQNTRQGDPLNARPQVFPGFAPLGEVFRASKNLALGWRSQLTPNINNELIVGFARFFFLFTQGEANPDFPNIVPYSFNNASLPFINTPRTARGVTTPQLLDNLSILKGAHQIGAGVNIRFYQHNDQRGQPGGINVTPTLSFSATVLPPAFPSGTPAGINSNDLTRLRGAINDVLGIPARLTQVFIGDINSDTFLPFVQNGKVSLFDVGTRLKQYNAYVQDEWKLRQNLTISYGVRMELNTPPKEAAGRVYVAQQPIDGSQGLVTYGRGDTFYTGDHDLAFGPRLGFAWSPGKNNGLVIRAGYGVAYDPISSFQVTAVMGRPPGLVTTCQSTVGTTPTAGCGGVPGDPRDQQKLVRIAEGFPLQLAAPTTKPSSFFTLPATLLSNAPPVAAFDPNYQMPTVHQWNLSVQHELPMGFIAQAAYIGRRGTHLQRAYDINQIDAGPILGDFRAMKSNLAKGCNPDGLNCPAGVTGQLISFVNYPTSVPNSPKGPLTQAFVNSNTTITDLDQNGAGNFAGRIEQTTLALKLRPNQQFGVITYIDAGGDSYYHSAQFTLRKRFEKGLLFGAAYTFGKSIDNQSVDPVGSSSGGGLTTTNSRTPTNIRNWLGERSRSDFDRTHVFTSSGVWELPVGNGKWLDARNRYVNTLIGGWTLNGIYTFMTGEPFSVTSGVRTANFSHVSRADVVKPVEAKLQAKAGVAGPVVFPDATAFTTPAPGSDGAGRNIFTASSYWNVDFGITKSFQLSERFRLDFRTEMFNAFNHTNFDNPRDASTGSPSILSTVFGQTCCAAVAPPTTQTIIQTGEAARVIQFALKLKF